MKPKKINKSGTCYLVFPNEDEASKFATLFHSHLGFICFGGYYNALVLYTEDK